MDKNMMDLSKAIRMGVANGIKDTEKVRENVGITIKSLIEQAKESVVKIEMIPDKCAKTLHTYCVEQNSCNHCRFYHEECGCRLNHPHLWTMEKGKEEQDNE